MRLDWGKQKLYRTNFGHGDSEWARWTVTERRMSNSLKQFTADAVTGCWMMNVQFVAPELSLKVVSKYKYKVWEVICICCPHDQLNCSKICHEMQGKWFSNSRMAMILRPCRWLRGGQFAYFKCKPKMRVKAYFPLLLVAALLISAMGAERRATILAPATLFE